MGQPPPTHTHLFLFLQRWGHVRRELLIFLPQFPEFWNYRQLSLPGPTKLSLPVSGFIADGIRTLRLATPCQHHSQDRKENVVPEMYFKSHLESKITHTYTHERTHARTRTCKDCYPGDLWGKCELVPHSCNRKPQDVRNL